MTTRFLPEMLRFTLRLQKAFIFDEYNVLLHSFVYDLEINIPFISTVDNMKKIEKLYKCNFHFAMFIL